MSPKFSSQSQQQYSPGFSYQGLLNAPNVVYVAATSQPSNVSQKKQKTSQNPEPTQATTVRRWNLAEDIALTNARLHVSSDADVGTGQKSETLWNRILQVWRENMVNFDATRDSNSLECRWGRLQGAINEFHGCYERAERLKKSGTTLEDVKRAALRLYQDSNNNQAFKHEECWEICRKNVKWCTKHLTKQDASRRQKSVVDGSNGNPPTSKQTQTDPSPIAGSSSPCVNDGTNPKIVEAEKTNDEVDTRPEDGRKTVKDQKRKVGAEKGVADALGNFQSSLERQFELIESCGPRAEERKREERL